MQEDSQASFLVILTPSHTTSFIKDNSLRVLAWVVEGMEWSSLEQTGRIQVRSLRTWQTPRSLEQRLVSREITDQVVAVLWSRLDSTSWQFINRDNTSAFRLENTETSEILDRTAKIRSSSVKTLSLGLAFHSATATLKAFT